ncbi:MAG: 1,4-dihydroxy-2-naphthoate octaprenyltransferase [Proteobacteria bacterium]|nr:1,4-dihydroxy-2-naphthoate octaprenyltransferase [Pseudomonadota bacterium]MBU1741970.1 1,4-dihydroxy-2-naphthoate octaprenyltransferase [Pseudomonadota bacterium]
MNVYIRAMRLPFCTGSVLPVIVVGAAFWAEKPYPWLYLLACVVGVACLHLGANLINDYFDAKGSDPINVRATPFSGGSRVIQEGLLSAPAVLTMALGFFAAAFVIGLAVLLAGRPWVALVGGLGFLAGLLYSAAPLQLMSRGVGEIVLFFAFGPLLTWGAGYVLTGRLAWQAFMLGLPLGWIITAVLWINQFPDLEADRDAGKATLVVRLGLERSRVVYLGLMLLPYPTLIVLSLLQVVPWWTQVAWLSLPLAVKAVGIAWKNPAEVLPAQGLTIMTHTSHGLLMTLGLILGHYL